MEAVKTFNWPITIYYEDTDAGGVVYHSNYLKYFERARTELLRENGVSQQALLEADVGFVVRHLEIDYIKGAKLDDMLVVRTHISDLRRASIEFCQDLVNNEGQILCKAVVKVACINSRTMKPIAIPENIKSEISSDC
ncbi:acyl-CoA thioesterase [Photobacterium jeanii]|uniref:Acyl-CoA thioesterase n=1 Tax=Photobacterium jeanii TaxID=858640 RepID=A0A178KMK9_9GAMM|nr:tol-pal system-associated acyl-CoA thioesterase [Photobacterium jeanii]OAN18430.1 acyl-CoA thioesterase [Photobacterium jeanii]PST91889.1 tol-pal system-associated acyl-CoA thioesterase [Photobacterium jeanii]